MLYFVDNKKNYITLKNCLCWVLFWFSWCALVPELAPDLVAVPCPELVPDLADVPCP
ncbi:hypothetical protein HYD81_03955 [Mycoplasmopsis bovis]|nr:hypothetical protein [Mycoplasmopsis bovis]QQH42668.1 hypothetical protein HYD81_03955 [Mycoplasmopsis bovis]